MSGFNYPFGYDGVGYFGFLAGAYNAPTLAQGLQTTWSDQAPIYYSIQLLASKLFGFSYSNALWVQSALIFLLVFLNFHQIYWSMHRFATQWNQDFSKRLFLLIGIAVVATSGFLSIFPGNVFDFRIDIIGSLLLTSALISLEKRNASTAFWVALAFCERFHNLSIILATLGIWTFFQNLPYLKKGDLKGLILSVWKDVRAPLIGLAILIGIRWPQIYSLTRYYIDTHFGAENAGMRQSSGWSTPGYLTFYPKALWNTYLHRAPFVIWMIISSFFLLLVFRLNYSRYLKEGLKHFSALLSGVCVAILLLLIDPTRNNIGVIRFTWIPLVFYLITFFSFIFIVAQKTVTDRSTGSLKGAIVSLAVLFCVWSIGAESVRIWKFWTRYDYLGMRKHNYAAQVSAAFQNLYQLDTPIRIAATFANDLNFTPHEWQIFLATHGLKSKPYEFLFGLDYFASTFSQQHAQAFKKATVVAVGSEGCRNVGLPLNQRLNENWNQVSEILKERCKDKISQVNLDQCQIDFLQCSNTSG